MTAAMYSRSDRSWPYIRSRDSDSPNAIAPIRRPTTVTLNAIRRSWLSWAVLPLASPVSAGESGMQRPHQPERRPGAHEQAGARQAALRVEVEVRERLVELMLAPVGARVLDYVVEGRPSRGCAAAAHGGVGSGTIAAERACGPSRRALKPAKRRRRRPISSTAIAPKLEDTSARASSARISTGTWSALAT